MIQRLKNDQKLGKHAERIDNLTTKWSPTGIRWTSPWDVRHKTGVNCSSPQVFQSNVISIGHLSRLRHTHHMSSMHLEDAMKSQRRW